MGHNLLLLLVVWWWSQLAAAAGIRVEFFDVGQGDAALITSPTGKRILIDGGPPEGEAHLIRRLASREPLDLILLTHRHADHMAALPALVRRQGVRIFLDGMHPHPSPIYDDLVQALASRNVEVRDAVAGRNIDLGGGARLTLLGPPGPPITGSRSDVNSNSVVARLDYSRFSVLFAADAEADTERWLLSSGKPLRARVVKVPHHGSRHSSTTEFVAAVRPEIAIVSVGVHNDYGHPSPEALARWMAVGARVYRTDLAGDIALTSDGESIVVSTNRAETEVAPRSVNSEPRQDFHRPRRSGSLGGFSPAHDTADSLAPLGPPSASGGYVASLRSDVFHRADCPNAARIVEYNRITFSSREEALATSRRPAQDCRP